MKPLLVAISILLCVVSFAQNKYAIIDPTFYKPLRYSDTITKKDLKEGFYFIRVENIDSFINVLKQIKDLVSVTGRNNKKEFDFPLREAKISGVVKPMAHGDRYKFHYETEIPFKQKVIICNPINSNLFCRQLLESNISYILKDYPKK